jgi:hypothetical protein
MIRYAVACCLLLAANPSRVAASARVGDAEVRAGPNGEPCFTISEREERRGGVPDFNAIVVSDPQGRKPLLWRMAMPRERTFPVSFNMCIPYAGRARSLPHTPAEKLGTGKVYHVRIEARGARGGSAAAYEARFCLARQHDGSVIVHHIGRDDHEGRRLYGCLPPAD